MIPFNKPCYTGSEQKYLIQVFSNNKYCGDGEFTKKCHQWFEAGLGCQKALLTTSCTHALEMSAILADIRPDDEVIMPSFTFVSTANAFVLRGAKIVFLDIRPDTMNIDETLIEAAITPATRAIVPVHYAGVPCEMDVIMDIASRHKLLVIEDAAQAILSKYKDRYAGTIGHLGCSSFHETKNIQCGEGGALLINDAQFIERAEIIREKGTNRSRFFRGQVDKYTWVDVGSSYLPSELNAAFLYAQLENAEKINADRLRAWNLYYSLLLPLKNNGRVDLPVVPSTCSHNAHMFCIKCRDIDERMRLINHLKNRNINAVFHYVPLHDSPAGKCFGRFHGEDVYTTRESERLLRLPMYFGVSSDEVEMVSCAVIEFFS